MGVVRNLVRRPEASTSSSGSAAARAVEPGLKATIAQGPDFEIKLIEVISTEPPIFDEGDAEHVFCLVIGEGRFNVESAVEWLQRVKTLNRSRGVMILPSFVILADTTRLSPDENYLLSTRRAGASLCKWETGKTREQAFEQLRNQLKRNYGTPNLSDEVQWGRTPAENFELTTR
jgi:hypothetical protein